MPLQSCYVGHETFDDAFPICDFCFDKIGVFLTSHHYIKTVHVRKSIAFPGSCFISPCFPAPPLF